MNFPQKFNFILEWLNTYFEILDRRFAYLLIGIRAKLSPLHSNFIYIGDDKRSYNTRINGKLIHYARKLWHLRPALSLGCEMLNETHDTATNTALISFARISIRSRPGRLNCLIVSALNANGEMPVGGDNATIMFAVILRIGTGAVNR